MLYTTLEIVWKILGILAMIGAGCSLMMLALMAHKVETDIGKRIREKEKQWFWGFVQLTGYSVVGLLLIYGWVVIQVLVMFRSLVE